MSWSFTGVALDGGGSRPSDRLKGLGLVVDDTGLTTTGPDGPPQVTRWDGVDWAEIGAPDNLGRNRPAVALAAGLDGVTLRWLIPADQCPPATVAEIDQLLTEVLAAPRPAPRRRLPAPVLVGALLVVVVGAAIGVTAALGGGSAPKAGVTTTTLVLGSAPRGAAVGIVAGDLPDDWTTAPFTGPIARLVAADLNGTAAARSQFVACTGGHAPARPLAVAATPVVVRSATYRAPLAPPGELEVVSVADTYRSARSVAPVAADVASVAFAQCFPALGSSDLTDALAADLTTGTVDGSVAWTAVNYPSPGGTAAVGFTATLPIRAQGRATDRQALVVVVAGHRTVAVLYGFTQGASVPASVVQSLVVDLGTEIAAGA